MSEGRKRRRVKPAHKQYGGDSSGGVWDGYARVQKRERREQEASERYWNEVMSHGN